MSNVELSRLFMRFTFLTRCCYSSLASKDVTVWRGGLPRVRLVLGLGFSPGSASKIASVQHPIKSLWDRVVKHILCIWQWWFSTGLRRAVLSKINTCPLPYCRWPAMWTWTRSGRVEEAGRQTGRQMSIPGTGWCWGRAASSAAQPPLRSLCLMADKWKQLSYL